MQEYEKTLIDEKTFRNLYYKAIIEPIEDNVIKINKKFFKKTKFEEGCGKCEFKSHNCETIIKTEKKYILLCAFVGFREYKIMDERHKLKTMFKSKEIKIEKVYTRVNEE